MHPSRHWRWWLVLALLLSGCVYHWQLPPQGAATAWDPAVLPGPPAVQVVTSDQLDRPYKKIGIVHAPGSMGGQDALAVLKQEAQALRGDALLNVRKRGSTATIANASTSLADQPWDAEVIVWADHQAEGVAPPSPGAPPH
jgi:hypothetical protein